jgi:hypothetical protein
MALSIRTRVLNMMIAELRTIPGIGYVAKDLRGFTQLHGDQFPAAFVIGASGTIAQSLPARQHRVEMAVEVVGYVKSPSGVADGVTDLREEFYQRVENAMLGTGLHARLEADLAAHGHEGATQVLMSGIPLTDEGEEPPFGGFILSLRAVLHYTRGAL